MFLQVMVLSGGALSVFACQGPVEATSQDCISLKKRSACL